MKTRSLLVITDSERSSEEQSEASSQSCSFKKRSDQFSGPEGKGSLCFSCTLRSQQSLFNQPFWHIPLPLCLSFSLFSPSGKQFVAQVSFLLEKIVLTRVLCAALGCSPKLDKKNKNSKSWMYVYKPIPSQTRIQIIKDHPHQYTWATCTLAGITSCWPLASVAGTAGEWSRLTH